ncbi:MAG: hypothetical protein K0S35_1382 [Geminicoccaceae bacterium]|nr:hypothetical protein [Geminicoccaceae bacterium]
MLAIDQRVTYVLLPIIGILILQAARIQAQERIVSEEQRPAIIRAERQPDTIELPPVPEGPTARPAAMVNVGIDRVAR